MARHLGFSFANTGACAQAHVPDYRGHYRGDYDGDYQISLAMELRWQALPAGSASN